MSRDWLAGDPAMVVCSDGAERRAAYLPAALTMPPTWKFTDNTLCDTRDRIARPLVVIDKESRADAEHLRNHLVDALAVAGIDLGVSRPELASCLQDALRMFLDPPAIEEPDKWCVVSAHRGDGHRTEWVNHGGGRWIDAEGATAAWGELQRPVLHWSGLESIALGGAVAAPGRPSTDGGRRSNGLGGFDDRDRDAGSDGEANGSSVSERELGDATPPVDVERLDLNLDSRSSGPFEGPGLAGVGDVHVHLHSCSSVGEISEGTAGLGPGGPASPYEPAAPGPGPWYAMRDLNPQPADSSPAWEPRVVLIDLDEIRELDHHLVVAINACRQRGRHRTVRVLEQLLGKVRPTPPAPDWAHVDEHGTHPRWTVLDTRPLIQRLQRYVAEAVERALRGEGS